MNPSTFNENGMIALRAESRADCRQVHVRFEDGILYLSGTVPELEMKRYAEDAVRSLSGVLGVSNNIALDSAPNPNEIGAFSASEKIM
jgi:hypothetical protein